MLRFLKQCSILLGLVSCLAIAPQAYAAKPDTIADFIRRNQRGGDVVVNAPKYDQNAKVFFLFYMGYNVHKQNMLESISKPLIPVYKKMAGSGAELVMYLDFPVNQSAKGANKKKGKVRRNTTTEKRILPIKCPVINVYHSEAREALFKADGRGKEQSYGTYDLRATDAKGIPLAYFSYEKGEIMMRNAQSGKKKSIGTGKYIGNEWVGPAILASYPELVASVKLKEEVEETTTTEEGMIERPKREKNKRRLQKAERDMR